MWSQYNERRLGTSVDSLKNGAIVSDIERTLNHISRPRQYSARNMSLTVQGEHIFRPTKVARPHHCMISNDL